MCGRLQIQENRLEDNLAYYLQTGCKFIAIAWIKCLKFISSFRLRSAGIFFWNEQSLAWVSVGYYNLEVF